MAELADAHGSGPCEGNFMGVRLPLSAPKYFKSVVILVLLKSQRFIFLYKIIFFVDWYEFISNTDLP